MHYDHSKALRSETFPSKDIEEILNKKIEAIEGVMMSIRANV